MMTDDDARYLTTREVADLLRVKERKVYDLAAADQIPHRRITGKLLFPAAEIRDWIEGDARPPRAAIIAGSHDPLLDWAAREAQTGLATLFDGSASGLDRFQTGEAMLSGLHIPEEGGWNLEAVAARPLKDAVLIGFARRRQGLIVPKGSAIASISDLAGRRVVLRQPGAGSRALFDRLAGGVALRPTDTPARTEHDAALAVAQGEADAAFGLEAAARQFNLGFVALAEEQYDLLIDRRAYFLPPVQTLLAFTRHDRFAAKAAELGGYDLTGLGAVRWVSA